MAKKVVTIVFALMILLGSSWGGPAAAQAKAPDETTWVVRGELYDHQTGQTIEVPVSVSQQGKDLSAEVLVPVQASLQALTDSNQAMDSAMTTRVTLLWKWDQKACGGDLCVKLERAEARWEKLDRQVTWKNANITILCMGQFENGGNCIGERDIMSIGNPIVNSWYVNGWMYRDRYIRVNQIWELSAMAKIDIVRGVSTWTLSVSLRKP